MFDNQDEWQTLLFKTNCHKHNISLQVLPQKYSCLAAVRAVEPRMKGIEFTIKLQ